MIPKFRFWYEREDYYPDENYMRHVWEIEYIADNKIKLNDDYIFNPYTNVAESIYAKTKIYLMQSTGLKDKNGVEIYEGDIVRYTWDSPSDINATEKGKKVRISKVFWSDWRASWAVGKKSCNGDLFRYIRNGNTVEVIGNMWEDPELLEVAE